MTIEINDKKITVSVIDGMNMPNIKGYEQFEIRDGMYMVKSKDEIKLMIPLSNIRHIQIEDKD